MKKALYLLFLLLMPWQLLYGYDFVVDRLAYSINDDGATVTLTYVSHEYYNYYGDPEDTYFDNYYDMTSVTVPKQVEHEGVSYRVTMIGEETFLDCSGLTSISLPSTLQSIGDRAFKSCTSLNSIHFPASLTQLSPTAFLYCSGLESISVDESNAVFDSRNSCNGLIESSSNTLVLGCTGTLIPDDVTSIGAHAFDGSGISSITIPESVRSFSADAFANCPNLTQVHISDLASWCSIDFDGQSSNPLNSRYNKVVSIDVPRQETVWQTEVTYLKRMHLFVGDQEVVDLVIPDGVSEIKAHAFGDCSFVNSVHIPSSVRSIGKDAFLNMSSCNVIDIEDLAAWCSIDFANAGANPLYDLYYIFYEIEKPSPYTLEDYVGTEIEEAYNDCKRLYLNGKQLSNLIIPEGVTQIKPFAFISLFGASSITIPSTVNEIGTDAFKPSSNLWYDDNNEPVGIFHELVWNAKNCPSRGSMNTAGIRYLTIGSEVESVPDSLAFESHLQSLSLPASVERIGAYAFADCGSLTDIYAEPLTPPACESTSFTRFTSLLHTVNSAVAAYFDAPVWENFNNLRGDLIVPEQLSLDKTVALLSPRQTLQLHATVIPSDTNLPLVWHSVNPDIASVDYYGQVRGLNDGETDIVVTCHNLRAQCHIVVGGNQVTVTLDKHELTMEPNDIETLTPTVTGEASGLVTTSSDVNVAKSRVVGNTIQVVAVGPGRAVITVSTPSPNTQSDSCVIIVSGGEPVAGDVSGDGHVDITDVNEVINMMLGKTTSSSTADLSGDGQIDIEDLNAVINIMLGISHENKAVGVATVNGVSTEITLTDACGDHHSHSPQAVDTK